MRARFVCGITVWDGDSASRDSDNAPYAAPDAADYKRLVKEVAASQTQINLDTAAIDAVELITGGQDPNAVHDAGGIPVVAGLTVVEQGDGAIHKSVITLTNVNIVSTDGTVPVTDGAWGTQVIYTFPTGRTLLLGAHAVFPLGGVTAVTGGGGGFNSAANFGMGIGSIASAQTTEFGISTTQEDILAEMDFDLVAKASDAAETAVNATSALFDGHTTAIDLHLNFRTLADGDHGVNPDTLRVNGTITLLWSNLGDD